MARPVAAPLRNPDLVGFRSLTGGELLPVGDYPEGCPSARANGQPTSVAAVYARAPKSLPPVGLRMDGMGAFLPYLAWAGLGEGGTPLIALPAPAPLGALFVKAEWMNPTGSHKDRASALTVARAAEIGARGVAVASSGNAGISIAAYAARAGLACRAVLTAGVPHGARRRLAAHGAELVEAPDALARWRILAGLAQDGWYPATNYAVPASGSSAWGVEGYRTVAVELAAAQPDGIDAILVPTARGDLVSGIALGFAALRAAGLWAHAGPRLIAIEPFARLSAILAGRAQVTDSFEGATRQASIAGSTATDQALRAVRDTGGGAIVVSDAAAQAAQGTLARQGIFLELSAAAPFAALPGLAGDLLRPGERIVLIATASADRETLAEAAAPTELAAT